MGIFSSIYEYWTGTTANDNVVDPGTGLTVRQKRLIADSWVLLGSRKDQKRFGVNFFIQLFKAYPYQKDLFPLFKNKTLDELEMSPIMRAHATTVMYQIGSFVDNLDDVECLVGLVQKVARNHIARDIGVQEFEELQEMFGPFLKQQLGGQATDEVVQAWDKLLGVMNSVIATEAIAEAKKTKS